MRLQPIASEKLSEKVYNALRVLILGDDLPGGAGLCIDELARTFGVSTTPIREALSRLTADGLVEWIPNRQPTVAAITKAEIHQLYAVRILVEPHFACLLAGQIGQDPANREKLAQLSREIEGVLANLETQALTLEFYERYMRIDHRLQDALADAMPEGILRKLADLVNNFVFRLRLFGKAASGRAKTERVQAVLTEHLTIIQAILDCDPVRVRDAVTEHLIRSEGRAIRAFDEIEGEETRAR